MLIYVPDGPSRVKETLESDIMFKLFLHIFLFIFIFCSSSVLNAEAQSLSHEKEKSATSILLFGDSIVAGYRLARLQKLDHKLETKLKDEGYEVNVINGGVSGDTTAGGRNRIKWTLEQHKPDIIVVALGGNDLLRGFPPHVVKLNLESILKESRERGVFIILSAVKSPLTYGRDYQKKFNAIYPALAEQFSVPLYPFLLEGVIGSSTLMQKDKIHPNEDGIELIADGLADFFIENMQRSKN